MTDNGSCYVSKLFGELCSNLHIKHMRTRAYTPQTNGKAERFIPTCLREWAYRRSYETSDQRNSFLQPFLHAYNWHRPHSAIGHIAPINRLGLSENNLLTLHS